MGELMQYNYRRREEAPYTDMSDDNPYPPAQTVTRSSRNGTANGGKTQANPWTTSC